MNSGPTGRPYRDLSDEGRPFGALGRVADRKPRALLLADIGLARWAEEPNCRGNGSVSFGAEAPHSRDIAHYLSEISNLKLSRLGPKPLIRATVAHVAPVC